MNKHCKTCKHAVRLLSTVHQIVCPLKPIQTEVISWDGQVEYIKCPNILPDTAGCDDLWEPIEDLSKDVATS